MGKRSNFERVEKDAYMTTDARAARPLLEYYGAVKFSFYEPCAGNCDLIELLSDWQCVGYSDDEIDARNHNYHAVSADYFITNPPWSREILHPIINNLRMQLPTWLLFDADWMFTAQSNPYMKFCKTVIPVGRLKWIPGSNNTGKDNCAWYLFVDHETECTFIPKLGKQVNS